MDITLSDAITAVVKQQIDSGAVSQAAFARKAGITTATLSRKLSRTTGKVSADEIERFAESLGWSAERLVKEARLYRDALRSQDPGLPDDPYALAAKKRPKK